MVGVGVGDEQGSEKWIAQIAALLDKVPSVGQICFLMVGQCMSNCPIVGQCMSSCPMILQCMSNCPMIGQWMFSSAMIGQCIFNCIQLSTMTTTYFTPAAYLHTQSCT